jgi:uncharacterized membrane protein YbhN (UPF0104 family)
MTGRWWTAARVAGGLAVLGVLAGHVGTEPFVTGLRAVGPGSIGLALLVVAGTTVCSAQRWRLVARGYGVQVSLRAAAAAYYRSQFLNSVLPGGVLGDVHRGLTHRAIRSVLWERVLGQAVAVAFALLVVLVAWPAASAPSTAVLAAMAVAGIVLVAALVVVLADRGVLEPEVVPPVLALSALAAAGHAAVFVVAARAVGVDATSTTLVPIALVVLVAAAVPVNVAGWGPREGAAAWAFAAAGLGAAAGASVAVAYGVLALLATLPGALLLAVRRSASRGDLHEARQVVAPVVTRHG